MTGNRQTGDWKREWAGLSWSIESRSNRDDGGRTLRIGDPGDADRYLRFDCFRKQPHWHLAPGGRDEIHPLDELGSPASESVELIRRELPRLMAQAGASEAECAALHDEWTGPESEVFLRDLERALHHEAPELGELDLRVLEARRSEKWHTYPRDVLPAWVAEMDFGVAAPIEAELRRFTDLSDLGYPVGLRDTGLAEVFRDRMTERFDWSPDPARVEILSEVVQGMYVALEAFSDPGDGIVVQTPIYPPFLHAVRETGRRLDENRLVPQASDEAPCGSTDAPRGPRLGIDFDALEDRVDDRTRVLLFCNPHNPSGRVFSRDELERLAAIVLERDWIVVSDEIHGELVHDGRVHVPFASLSPAIAERTLTLTSPSKAFNIPGLRCAVAHFGSASLQKRFNTVFPRHVRGGIGLIGLYASIAAWRLGQPWLDEVRPYLEANRDFAEAMLAERIPEIDFYSPEATYLAWLDCTALELSGAPAAHFLRQGRVALSNGKAFGEGWESHVRLNFATSRPILTEVIERMAKAVGR